MADTQAEIQQQQQQAQQDAPPQTEQADSQTASSTSSWSDADYIRALHRLQRLQAQIDSLRAALPSLIAPLNTPPDPSPASTVSPSSVYAEFAAQAMQATKDVKALREEWESPDVKRILQHAQDCLDKDAEVDWEFVKIARWGDVPEPLSETNGQSADSQGQATGVDSDIKNETS